MTEYTSDLKDAAGYAHVRVYGRVPAEDIMQATLLKMLEAGYDAATADRALVFSIARNAAIDMAKLLRDVPSDMAERQYPSHGAMVLRNNPDPSAESVYLAEAGLVGWEQGLRDLVDRALAGLDGVMRWVAQCYYLDGLDANQTADLLRKNPGAVRIALMRARTEMGAAEGDCAIWRRYQHPDAKRPQGAPEPSEELLEMLAQ